MVASGACPTLGPVLRPSKLESTDSIMTHRNFGNWAFLLTVICSLAGCMMTRLEPEMVMRPSPEPVVPVAWSQVASGDFCELEASIPEISKIAGRVVSIDENSIVMADAVSMERRDTHAHNSGKFSKVPYANRLFKNTGVLVSPVPIPGEITLPKNSLKSLSKISPEAWPDYRREGFARIGIDFDFDVTSKK